MIPKTLGFKNEKSFVAGGNDILRIKFGQKLVGYVWGFQGNHEFAFIEVMLAPKRGMSVEEHWSSSEHELVDGYVTTHDPFTLKSIMYSLLEREEVTKYLKNKPLDTEEQP